MCTRTTFVAFITALLLPILSQAETVSALDPRKSNILDGFYDKPDPGMALSDVTERWVTVEATADMSAGVEVARRSALLAAYRQAVAAAPLADNNKAHWRNFRDVVDMLTKERKNIIERYEVLGGGVDKINKNLYRLRMKALVVSMPNDTQEQNDSLNHFLDLIIEPRIVLLLSDKSPVEEAGSTLSNTRTAELMITRDLKKVGYTVLTSKDVIRMVGKVDYEKTKNGDVDSAAHVGRVLNADLVLTGTFDYESVHDKAPADKQGLCCNTYKFKWQAVLPGSSKEVSVETRKDHESTGGNELRDMNIGMISAMDAIASDLKWKVLNILSTQTHDVSVEIKNISYNKADSIRRVLASLEGVEKVEMQDWNESGTRFIVKNVYIGPREQDLREILDKSFDFLRLQSIGNDKLIMSF